MRKTFGRIAAVAAAVMLSASALQAQSVTTGDVNMRVGPSVGQARISVLAAGTPVNVFGCLTTGWCEVASPYGRGWISGRYIGAYRPAPAPVMQGWYGYATPAPHGQGWAVVPHPGWGQPMPGVVYAAPAAPVIYAQPAIRMPAHGVVHAPWGSYPYWR